MGGIRKLITVSLLLCCGLGLAEAKQSKAVFRQDASGTLVYDADERGNVVPDFSGAGYGGGGLMLPRVDAKVRVSPSGEDDTRRIQAAIDWVSKLPLDERGIRGAVLLAPGEFLVEGQLRIEASGVVLRGSGGETSRTVLRATGDSRRHLLVAGGAADPKLEDRARTVVGDYVPVGSHELEISAVDGLVVGDSIRIVRPGSQDWVVDLGMHEAPARLPYNWKGEKMVLQWDRRIEAIDGNRLRLDAPITTALERKYGQSEVRKIVASDAISQVGIERLACVSDFNESNSKDENHSWVAVSLEGVVDSWVSDVSARHFVLSAVRVGEDCRRVTVQDCSFLEPVSELAGYRRQSFNTYGQQTLFLRCYSEYSIDDFTVGHLASGPNVFLECRSKESSGVSGSIGHWASGMLFDSVHVDGGALALDNREIWNQGVGWAAANSVIYDSSASEMITRRPPTANNWAINVWGQFRGDGTWIGTSEFANPKSLYVAQLQDRLGEGAEKALQQRIYISNRMAIPELETVVPELPIETVERGDSLELIAGQLQAGGMPLVGRDRNVTWWRGRLLPTRAGDFGYSITRFTPGRSGAGLTDDLDLMTDEMVAKGDVSLRHNYGLWYDRRRDDHEMTRRRTADVWPPFYEQPFYLSGEGRSWNGLSKYDLFQYNSWYFERLDEFAELAQRKRLVLVNEMFFQHNILESGGHWVDCPWRPVNTIQETDFTEPPPFKGDTIVMAPEFYDITHPVRREVNRAYIRKCLDNLAERPNVIHVIGAEYSGPLHFMEFWIDVVAEWMEETGHDPLIGLSCAKNVQDAILTDPERSGIVDVIDFQYWWYLDDGIVDPAGGRNLSPRRSGGKRGSGSFSVESLARMVSEYREKFPDKAVITTKDIQDPWSYTFAGGSLAPLARETDASLMKEIAAARPLFLDESHQWAMQSERGSLLVRKKADVDFDHQPLNPSSEYEFILINAVDGSIDVRGRYKAGDKRLKKLTTTHELFWLRPL
ncbi:DUF6298 domain-containing protein [Pelagicoccus sp. SDUM812005]|uniref:DUF6298 domain-containing protein n=1 Tax=Pelagicoccus sp. SDUM812005 TaxID=3041257 RepID=UPI00280CF3B0|nr:DUF6298 domain-containing protein [Pelagicoccus sp. SDUM812005]MDQ8179400.1 DUF6298 domain-containing protein [Pelagicoccus sp. SDUM812005]